MLQLVLISKNADEYLVSIVISIESTFIVTTARSIQMTFKFPVLLLPLI